METSSSPRSKRKASVSEALLQKRSRPSRCYVPECESAAHSRPAAGRLPEEGSIRSIICNNPRKRLYVAPIAWTSEHLQLLANDRGKRASARPDSSYPNMQPFSRIGSHRCGSLPFDYERRAAAKLPTDGVFSSYVTPSSLAYITFDTIKSLREKYTRVFKAKSVATVHIRRHSLRVLEPPNPVEDPYIVALLIALVQDQRRQQQRGRQHAKTTTDPVSSDGSKCITDSQACNKVNILAITGFVTTSVYVYTAIIPVEFLDKFDNPTHSSPSSPITVTCGGLPVKGAKSFETLHRLLCSGFCKTDAPQRSNPSD
ncbi:hypothetical protein P170DRAFT_463911 [Aspergillus steynii IBT 23096]|uniref:Uncharacterized protein n=1 Tax=Aspergillus steynii IBT 23096 TaxID=1392250 RepID=A0A2I2GD74_9EURO|nr:uncharacterized protein P170DRAFT_463911 [Aspergillus steynii IBT 23096]PLB50825.1 hypothetical protein P170DRAFT_463911 [Aspergillus steynii IBT 23096]